MSKIDLHIHSVFSDGNLSPYEIIRELKYKKITKCSIADHDTIINVFDYEKMFEYNGIDFVRGVELSTEFKNMHILGYGMNKPEILHKVLESIKRENNDICIQVLNLLKKRCFDVTLEELDIEKNLSKSTYYDKRQIARLLLKKGYASNTKEVYDNIIGRKTENYIPIRKITESQAVQYILASGGVPILAHPSSLGIRDEKEFEKLILQLIEYGLMGIEIINLKSINLPLYERLADKYALLKTIGSDFHSMENIDNLGLEDKHNVWDNLVKEIEKQNQKVLIKEL